MGMGSSGVCVFFTESPPFSYAIELRFSLLSVPLNYHKAVIESGSEQ